MKPYAVLVEAARHLEAFDDLLERRDIAELFLNLAHHYLAYEPAMVCSITPPETIASRGLSATTMESIGGRITADWLDFLGRERRAVLLEPDENDKISAPLYLVPFLFGWDLVGFAALVTPRPPSSGQEEIIRLLARAAGSAWGRVREAAVIRLERDRAEGLFESIVSPLVLIDRTGNVVRANAGARAVIGGSALADRHYQEFFGFTQRDPIAEVLAGSEAIHRIDVPGRDGRIWGITVSPYVFAGGGTGASDARIGDAVVVGFRDLTGFRRVEEKLASAERQAAIGRMASTVAHEVNNPLGAVKAQLRLLKRRCESDAEAGKKIGIVEAQIDRIERTVRALLTFSRQRNVRSSRVRIVEIIETVLDLFAGGFAEKGIELASDLPLDLPEIVLDTDQVQEVLVNLLENARDALEKGRRVRVAAARIEGGIEVVVEDDGPGLGEDPERLFEPFYTTKTAGTGLGLSIARRICETHGGLLGGENRAEGGARFRAIFRPAR